MTMACTTASLQHPRCFPRTMHWSFTSSGTALRPVSGSTIALAILKFHAKRRSRTSLSYLDRTFGTISLHSRIRPYCRASWARDVREREEEGAMNPKVEEEGSRKLFPAIILQCGQDLSGIFGADGTYSFHLVLRPGSYFALLEPEDDWS